ncbi:MAG TPA: protein kinase [Labilithrix sp.]|nr:protein kinase [Labilithrix sp.]
MSHSSTPSPYPAPGEIIDGAWRVEKILGEGGMGAVALAWDLFLHTPVAIKFMNPQFLTFPGAEQRFLNEGRASALIKSDHVVPVTKAGKTSGGTPFLVMEALEGLDLADVIARDGSPGLPIERAVHFVLQVLRALQAAHAIGIIHRDMKPSNCFAVVKDGEADFVKILDFGISKVQQPGSASLTQTNSALGTPLYMSPEQARSPRDVDARSDLYSVGVILYELLTGHTPFFSESGEFTEILFKLFTAEPPPVQSTRPDVPDGLAAAVHKALAREVNDRFSTAGEMAEAIAPWAGERSMIVLNRIRAFKAPPKGGGSIAPPEDLPESMVAFSQIGASTGVMANRPTTDVMKSPPVTELLVNAPGRVPATPRPSSDPPAGARMSATPQSLEARARPEDAQARTQYDNMGTTAARPAGVSTDLGAARDASLHDVTEKKRSPLIFALPLLAVLGIIGGVIAFTKSGEKSQGRPALPTADPTLPVVTAATSVATIPVTPPPLTASAALTAPTPSASVSASAARTATRPPPTVPPHPTSTSVLDTQIKN